MTRQEVTGTRDLTISKWIRDNLPDSRTGFLASDLDFIVENWRSKKIAFLEIKTHRKNIEKKQKWQKILFSNIDRWVRRGICEEKSWKYMGFFILLFDKTSFQDGKAWIAQIDGMNAFRNLKWRLISEQEVIDKFSF